MNDGFRELVFPLGGINQIRAFGDDVPVKLPSGQFGFTCRDALNVRSYEPESLRPRGGSRPALIQSPRNRPANGACQCLEQIVFIDPTP